ncbi:winged helix-turn-helix transcriptional regulator [Rubrivirga sp. IMCC43871]|uniref:winged helix-turn-helix transcriptional regulator n=1 Tax=Rubrivirga sp. IMCC43871 TaxID=3391575 RepID=UPI0039900E77
MVPTPCSDCPIASSLCLLGDRWTLVVVRDVLLLQIHSFSEIGAGEGIATNVLADRLERLVAAEIIERRKDPADGRRRIYVPTERAIALIPILLDLVVWGDTYTSGSGQAELAQAIRSDREALIAQLDVRARQAIAEHAGGTD